MAKLPGWHRATVFTVCLLCMVRRLMSPETHQLADNSWTVLVRKRCDRCPFMTFSCRFVENEPKNPAITFVCLHDEAAVATVSCEHTE